MARDKMNKCLKEFSFFFRKYTKQRSSKNIFKDILKFNTPTQWRLYYKVKLITSYEKKMDNNIKSFLY